MFGIKKSELKKAIINLQDQLKRAEMEIQNLKVALDRLSCPHALEDIRFEKSNYPEWYPYQGKCKCNRCGEVLKYYYDEVEYQSDKADWHLNMSDLMKQEINE